MVIVKTYYNLAHQCDLQICPPPFFTFIIIYHVKHQKQAKFGCVYLCYV